jgi:hypothetical protein
MKPYVGKEDQRRVACDMVRLLGGAKMSGHNTVVITAGYDGRSLSEYLGGIPGLDEQLKRLSSEHPEYRLVVKKQGGQLCFSVV